VLFHRVHLIDGGETRYFQKLAYDVPCIEVHGSSSDFAKNVVRHDLKVLKSFHVGEMAGGCIMSVLCEKVNR
jgi:hypothetical protein